MLATFCLRLACGLAGALILLSPKQVHPRFYRVQFWTVLGLTGAAAALLAPSAGLGLWVALAAALLASVAGSLSWSLEGAPGGRTLIGVTVLALVAALGLAEPSTPGVDRAWLIVGDLTSAALLGTATTAMLMGHSYLVAPGMAIAPLLRLLAALFAVTALRMAVAGVGLWSWTAEHPSATLDETVLWLPVRWGLGFVAPLVLAWMAREAAKIRSTQSATGILYVVVVFCFLGELTSLLMSRPGQTL
jgi:hypothetical protein